MKKLFAYFIDRSFLINLVSVFIILIGGLLALNLKRDIIPPFSFKGMSVGLNLKGAHPLQMESFVARPVEEALRSLPDVKEITVTSYPSYTDFDIRFEDRISHERTDQLVDQVKSRIAAVRGDLPKDLDEPDFHSWKREDSWFASLALVNFDAQNDSHRQAVVKIKNALTRIPGVLSLTSNLPKREIYIRFLPKKLEEYGLNKDQILDQVYRKLIPTPITSVRSGYEDISIQLPDDTLSPQLLENLVLRAPDFGPTVLLKNVAHVEFYAPPQNEYSLLNGKPYLNMWVKKDLHTDVVSLTDQLNKEVDTLRKSLPEGLDLQITGRGADLIGQQLSVLKLNALMGCLLVCLLLSAFLGMRIAFMTALGLPLAYLGSVIVLNACGININLISVVAMIVVVGILVDDAIIVAERYAQNLARGLTRRDAALEAAASMVGPVTAGILTTMIAFVPILILGGWLTEVLFSIPIVIISSLAISWLEAFFVLPNHLAHFVKKPHRDIALMTRLRVFYQASLSTLLRFRYVVLLMFFALVAGTGYLTAKKIRTKFNLRIGTREVTLYAILKESPSIEETLKKLEPLQKYLATYSENPDIPRIYLDIGDIWMDGKRMKGPRYVAMNLSIRNDIPNPDVIEENVLERLKKELPAYKTEVFERLSAEGQFSDSEDGDSTENMFDLYFRGSTPVAFTRIVEETQKELKSIPGYVDVNYNRDDIGRAWQFEPRNDMLQKFNMTESQLSADIRQALNRQQIGTLYWNDEALPVTAGLSEPQSVHKVEELKNLVIPDSNGRQIPLSFLGSWKENETLLRLIRKNGERTLAFRIKFDPLKTRAEDFEKALQEHMPQLQEKFSGYTVSAEMADHQVKENRKWLYQALAICIGGIFFIIALQLQSLTQPALVCTAILFGFIGALWALYAHHMNLDVMAMIGLLGVAGLSVNDCLVMVDWVNRSEFSRAYDRQTLSTRVSDRLQPILLTSLTTLAGLFPMAYGIGGDAGFTRPLAFSMAWGILASTVLTLVMIPVFLMVRQDVLGIAKKMGRKVQKPPAPRDETHWIPTHIAGEEEMGSRPTPQA